MLVVNSKGKRSKQLLRKLGNVAFGLKIIDYHKGGKEILKGVVNNKELPVLIVNSSNGPVKTSKFKFGKIPHRTNKIVVEPFSLQNNTDTLPAGNKGEHIPMTGWSGYSYDANRGGNANGCSDWLFKDRPASVRAKYGKFHRRNAYGVRVENSNMLYNERGQDGFEGVPRSIYGSGNVFLHDYTQASGTPLPRPYGPRDQAHLRGMPKPNRFGSEFIPHPTRTYKPAYVTYANDSLYLPEFQPSQQENEVVKETVAKINQKRMLGYGRKRRTTVRRKTMKRNRFGMLPLEYGPNNVGYENPFLMYDGAGGNTLNYLTGKNYLPPCTDRTFNKVQKNNNPTGYLASFGLNKFGSENNWSTPSGPWVMKDNLRPQTTSIINPSAGVTSAGPTRIAQPLTLYAYQNTPLASDKYPEFLGARSWYGGFGLTKKQVTNEYGKKKKEKLPKDLKKVKKDLHEVKKDLVDEKAKLKKNKKTLKQKKNVIKDTEKFVEEMEEKLNMKKKRRTKYGQKNIFDAISNIKEGDTIDITNGKLSIKKEKMSGKKEK